eukprot:g464.t1
MIELSLNTENCSSTKSSSDDEKESLGEDRPHVARHEENSKKKKERRKRNNLSSKRSILSDSLKRQKATIKSSYSKVPVKGIKSATLAIRESVVRAHQNSAFWLSTNISFGAYDKDRGTLNHVCGISIVSLLSMSDNTRFLTVLLMLVATILERPLWCFDDESFAEATRFDDQYFDSNRYFFSRTDIFVLDIVTSVLLSLALVIKIKYSITEASDVTDVLLLVAFSGLRTAAYADDNNHVSFDRGVSGTVSLIRFVLIFTNNRPIRTGFKMSFSTISAALDVFVLYLIFCIICACITTVLLGQYGEDTGVDQGLRSKIDEKYGNFWTSLRVVYYYTTKLTLPKDMSPAIEYDLSFGYLFAMLSLFGSFFFLPLFLASIVKGAKAQYTHELEKQRKALMCLGYIRAFEILDTDESGFIGYATARALVDSLFDDGLVYEKISTVKFKQIIQKIDENLSGTIDIQEFLSLCHLIQIRKPVSHSMIANMAHGVKDFEKSLKKRLMHREAKSNLERRRLSSVDGETQWYTTRVMMRFSRYSEKFLARNISPQFVLFLSNLFWEPAMGLIPAYKWMKIESKDRCVALTVLKRLGWGMTSDAPSVTGDRHVRYITPRVWSELSSERFADAVVGPVRRYSSHSNAHVRWCERWAQKFIKVFRESTSTVPASPAVRLGIDASKCKADTFPFRSKLLIQFFHLKMRPSETIEKYEQRVRKKRAEVETLTGTPVSDELAATALMNGLLPSIGSAIFLMDRHHRENRSSESSKHPSSATSALKKVNYDEQAKWLLNVKIPAKHVLGVGDYVVVTKEGSSKRGMKAIVLKIDNLNSCVMVQMCRSQRVLSYLSHQLQRAQPTSNPLMVLDRMEFEERAARLSERRNMPVKEIARQAAKAAIEGAIHARVLEMQLKGNRNICDNLNDAIAFQLFSDRRDRNRWLVYFSLLFQVALNVGSVFIITRGFNDEDDIGTIAGYDAALIATTFLVFLLKLVSSAHTGRHRDAISLAFKVAFEILPAIASSSSKVTSSRIKYCMFVVLVVHCITIFRLLARTKRFFALERLLQKSFFNILLILLQTILWMLVFAKIGMMSFGGLVWNDQAVADAGGNITWCAESVCTSAEIVYNFNTVENSLVLLLSASIKPFYFADLFNELAGLGSYAYFFAYWIAVPLANLLLVKAVLFQNYWKQAEKLQKVKAWLDKKEHRYVEMMNPGFELKRVKGASNGWGAYAANATRKLFGEPYEREIQRLMDR